MYTFKGMRRNLKYVLWGPTLHLLFLRAFGSALLVCTFFVIVDAGSSFTDKLIMWPIMVFAFTMAATFIYPWIGFIAWWILTLFVKDGKPRAWVQLSETFMVLIAFPIIIIASLLYLANAVIGMMGDPFVILLKKNKPQWVPVQQYGFFNPFPVIFVLDPERMPQLEGLVAE